MSKQHNAQVVSLTPMGAYFHLVLQAPGLGNGVQPGHFVAVAMGDSGLLLRRAFSIHQAQGNRLEILFSIAGAGTAWLAGIKPGAQLDVIAPLGNPFLLPRTAGPTVLVAGGYGAAPMGMLARALRERGCRVDVVLGAASRERLFGVLDLRQVADSVTVTTDDGSSGLQGRVTDALPEVLSKHGAKAVYACGPMPMLSAVAKVSSDFGAFSQCAVEEAMACGIGICMTCVLPVIGADGITRMVRSCTEGPVFRGDRVRWDEVGTIPPDTLGAGVH